MLVAGVVLAVLVVLGVALMLFYNALVRGRNLAEEAWSGISVQLRRRHDLVPALISVVQGYAVHEKDVLSAVAGAREAGMKVAGGDARAVGEAEKGLSLALGRLLAVAEAYPDLKANENFLQLQHSLTELENDIQMSRRYYKARCASRTTASCSFRATWSPDGSVSKKWNISSSPARRKPPRPRDFPSRRCGAESASAAPAL